MFLFVRENPVVFLFVRENHVSLRQRESCFSSSERIMFLSDEGPTLETLDFTIRIGSTPTFLYFDLYLNTAYATRYVYYNMYIYINGKL